MAKVSVVIPVYKVESYLDECIGSVLAQTHEDLEILCFDDGSPDGCPAMLDAYAEKDPRVKVIHQQNAGLGTCRNRGIEMADGEYIFFVDSDDYIAPDAIEKMVAQCEKTGARLCICNASDFDAATGKALSHNYLRPALWGGAEVFAPEDAGEDLYQITAANAWNKLYHRDLFADKRLRFYDGMRYEDTFFYFLVLLLAKRITYVDEPLYHYRRGRIDSLMSTDVSSCADIIRAYELARRLMEENGFLQNETVKKSFERKANGILLFNFCFQRGLPAYLCYYDALKKALADLDLLKEEGDYYVGAEREKQQRLMQSENGTEFLYWE
ncbi:MAG: glycosyltransferase, partial [Christensenellaceae bacterium]|nr:glycosyltransferase [Christensenellaceae bacterium]